MNNKDFRKRFDQKSWGNFKYDADNDTLWWGKYHIDHEFDTIDGALYWIAHMRATKKKFSERDAKHLSQALSELLECPGLANVYHTSHNTRDESKKKAMRDSATSSACDKCAQRFMCYTTKPQ